MSGFNGSGDFDRFELGFGEGHIGSNIAVVAISGRFISTGSESQFSSGSISSFRQGRVDSVHNSGAGEGGTGVDVHTFGSIRLDDGSDDFFNAVFTGYRIGFSLVVHIEGSDLTVFNGNGHFHLAAETLGSSGLGFRISRSHGQHAEKQAEGQEKSNKFLHGIPHPFL